MTTETETEQERIDKLLQSYHSAGVELMAAKLAAGRLEQEIMALIEERGAAGLPSAIFACKVKSGGKKSPPRTRKANATAISASPAINPDERRIPVFSALTFCSAVASSFCSRHSRINLIRPPTKVSAK